MKMTQRSLTRIYQRQANEGMQAFANFFNNSNYGFASQISALNAIH